MTLPRPCNNQILCRVLEANYLTPGGLHIPDAAKDSEIRYEEAEVLAVGPGGIDMNGKHVPVDCKVGDRVAIERYQGTDLNVGGVKYKIVAEQWLLCAWSKSG